MKQIKKEMEQFLGYPIDKGEQPMVYFGEEAQYLSSPVTRYDLLTYIKPLYEEISRNKERIKELETDFNKSNEAGVKTIVVEEMSKDNAIAKIKELFDKYPNESIYPSEIAEKLHIDYDLVFEIVEDLLREDEIEMAT
ncbi:MAG: hypothetical protein O8C62_03100 [Candidatus Methanoperedens sp.]|nr:hypothetical protein [Candidatus Methanoperedens sp.]